MFIYGAYKRFKRTIRRLPQRRPLQPTMKAVHGLLARVGKKISLSSSRHEATERTQVDDLPNEVWILVFTHIQFWEASQATFAVKALSNLTLVSHRFRLIAQPMLFQNTGLKYDPPLPPLERPAALHYTKLCEFLASRPDIARCVHKARFAVGSSGKMPEGGLELLGLLHQLVELQLIRVGLCDELLLRLRRASNLRICRLYHIRELPDYGNPFPQPLQLSKLRQLEVLHFDERVSQRTQQAVVTLAQSPKLERIRICCPTIVFGLLNSIAITATRAYCFTVMDINPPCQEHVHKLFVLLGSCPRLLDLRLLTGPTARAPEHVRYEGHLSSNAVPNLRTFEGALPLARLLVPGRPVVRLKLEIWSAADFHVSTEYLSIFMGGTCALQALEIEGATWVDGCLNDVAQLFPSLTQLNLTQVCGYPLVRHRH